MMSVKWFIVLAIVMSIGKQTHAQDCYVDICAAVDRHQSITPTDWANMMEHLARFVAILDMEHTGAQFGLVSFDELSTLDIRLNDHNTTSELQADIRAQPSAGYGRAIDLALFRIRAECFTLSNGDRLGAGNFAILITNGESDAEPAILQAQLLRDTGATIISIGVGSGINYDLLYNITTSEDLVFLVDDFQELEDNPGLVIHKICPLLEFAETPGVQKADPETYTSLSWRLHRQLDLSVPGSEVLVHHDNQLIISYTDQTGCVPLEAGYDCSVPAPGTTGFVVGVHVTSVDVTDAGVYNVTVRYNDIDAPVTDNQAELYVYQHPLVSLEGDVDVVLPEYYEYFELICNASSQSVPAYLQDAAELEYRWNISGSGVLYNGSDTLILDNVTREDHLTSFRCHANELGSSLVTDSDESVLMVTYVPEVTLAISEQTVPEHSEVILSCSVDSYPVSNINLTRAAPWELIASGSGEQLNHTISAARCQHTSLYRCSANNMVGVSMSDVSLEVTCSMRPTNIAESLFGVFGGNVTYEQTYTANPFPAINANNWTFLPVNDVIPQPLPPEVTTNLTETGHVVERVLHFSIENMTSDLQGVYSMVAENGHGEPATLDLQIDVDECSHQPCQSGGTCTNTFGSFYCSCPVGFTGSFCQSDINECTSAPCVNGGTCYNTLGSYSCVCSADYWGRHCQIERNHDPEFDSLSPSFGPVAGGTNITIIGQHFDAAAAAVYLGSEDVVCQVIGEGSETQIVAQTPAVNESLVAVPLSVSVIFHGQAEPEPITSLEFTYKGNPKIEAIYPLVTISLGGTLLTVNGTNLDAVAEPALDVSMTIRNFTSTPDNQTFVTETTQTFTEDCTVQGPTLIHCITPQMNISDEFLSPVNDSGITDTARKRKPEETISELRTTFYLGMQLDGVVTYNNISEVEELAQYGTIKVFSPPGFPPYEDQELPFVKNEPISIKGENLLLGLTQSDYTVDVGIKECTILDVTDSLIICKPPQEPPTDKPTFKSQHYAVIVHAGLNSAHDVGSMFYKSKLPIIVGCCAGLLVAIIIILAIVLRKKVNCSGMSNKHNKDNCGQNNTVNRMSDALDEDFESDLIQLGTVTQDFDLPLGVNNIVNDDDDHSDDDRRRDIIHLPAISFEDLDIDETPQHEAQSGDTDINQHVVMSRRLDPRPHKPSKAGRRTLYPDDMFDIQTRSDHRRQMDTPHLELVSPTNSTEEVDLDKYNDGSNNHEGGFQRHPDVAMILDKPLPIRPPRNKKKTRADPNPYVIERSPGVVMSSPDDLRPPSGSDEAPERLSYACPAPDYDDVTLDGASGDWEHPGYRGMAEYQDISDYDVSVVMGEQLDYTNEGYDEMAIRRDTSGYVRTLYQHSGTDNHNTRKRNSFV